MDYLKTYFRGIKMELYKMDNTLVINNNNECLNILNDDNYSFWITGNKKERKLPGTSFKINEYDRKLYKIFSDFYDELVENYNDFKKFHDYQYEEFPLYDSKHNWFTFYDDYSNTKEGNIFRIIKNKKEEPYVIGIYIRNKNTKLQTHTLAKSGSKYPQFAECFAHLVEELKKLEKEKIYTKKKEV